MAGHFCSFRAVVRGRDTDVCYGELPRIHIFSTTFVNKGNNRAEVARTQRLLPYSPNYLEGEVPEVCPYQCSQKNMRAGL